MAYDKSSKVSDMLTALQELTGINQKADLKSALIAKGVSAADTDSMADMISKLNNANLVLNGRRCASGSGSNLTVNTPLTISGLAFKPKTIIVFGKYDTMQSICVYSSNLTTYSVYQNGSCYRTNINDTANLAIFPVTITMNSNGFTLSDFNYGRDSYNWIAFE